jgi:hypothetical protein
VSERFAALEPNGHSARDLGRVACREACIWPYRDLLDQVLDVRLRNPAGLELRRLDIAVKERNRQEVRKAVVGVLLGVDVLFWTEASTSHEIVGVQENLSLDAHHSGRIEPMSIVQLDRTEDGRLSGNRSVCSSSGQAGRSNPVSCCPSRLGSASRGLAPDRLVPR